ncbi:MAG: ester cyclase [Syntrophorhabdales bacterium]|jgi:hypothetical protein
MPSFFLADIEVLDPKQYQEYVDRASKTGTFTKPMPTGDGKFIQPTGKGFSIPMCTVGRWKDGVMVEEWLFWDNGTYMKQIGIGN